MFTCALGEDIANHFAKYVANGKSYMLDGCGYEYKIIGGKYYPGDDRVFIELDPNYMDDGDWPSANVTRGDKFSIKPTKIIFNKPATIVFWDDGTKTVVKCTEREVFDYEKGVALCYMKKLLGNDNSFKHVFKKFNVPTQYRSYGDNVVEKLIDHDYILKRFKDSLMGR